MDENDDINEACLMENDDCSAVCLLPDGHIGEHVYTPWDEVEVGGEQ